MERNERKHESEDAQPHQGVSSLVGSNTTRRTASLVQRHVEDEAHGVVVIETGFLKLDVTCKEGENERTWCTRVCDALGPSCGKEDIRPSRGKVGKNRGLK